MNSRPARSMQTYCRHDLLRPCLKKRKFLECVWEGGKWGQYSGGFRELCGVGSPTFMWVPGTELRWPGTHGKSLYHLSHFASPQFFFFCFFVVLGIESRVLTMCSTCLQPQLFFSHWEQAFIYFLEIGSLWAWAFHLPLPFQVVRLFWWHHRTYLLSCEFLAGSLHSGLFTQTGQWCPCYF